MINLKDARAYAMAGDDHVRTMMLPLIEKLEAVKTLLEQGEDSISKEAPSWYSQEEAGAWAAGRSSLATDALLEIDK